MITSTVNGILLIWLALEVTTNFRHRSSSAPIQDKGSFRAVWITIAAAFLLSNTVGFWGQRWNVPIPYGLRVAGIVLLILGIIFRHYSIQVLGQFFTPRVVIQDQHTLVRHGPYRWLRHPSYTGAWVALTGVGLSSKGILSLLLFAVIPLVGSPVTAYK
jgi:Putative protein-S-isoprenylcysteine methyltransferase